MYIWAVVAVAWPLALAVSTMRLGRARQRDTEREREREGQMSSDSRSCFLHAPNPLLSGTCHTLAAKWNWLLISPLPQVSCAGRLQWAYWASCGTRGEEHKEETHTLQNTQTHKNTFLLTAIRWDCVKEDNDGCSNRSVCLKMCSATQSGHDRFLINWWWDFILWGRNR